MLLQWVGFRPSFRPMLRPQQYVLLSRIVSLLLLKTLVHRQYRRATNGAVRSSLFRTARGKEDIGWLRNLDR